MLKKQRILESLHEVAKTRSFDRILVSYHGSNTWVTKFANQRISQNLKEENAEIFIKVINKNRVGVSATNTLHKDDLQKALLHAVNISKVAPENPALTKFAKPAAPKKIKTYFEETLKFSLLDKAEMIKDAFDRTAKRKLTLSGTIITSVDEMAVVSSDGIKTYQPFSAMSCKFIPTDGKNTGFASALSRDINKIDFDGTLERAIEKCLQNKNQEDLELGKYDCILEPDAVAEILEWLGYIGFGAKRVMDHTSFLTANLGRKIMGENITIYDDGLNPDGFALPFDYEGNPRKKIALIEKGVAKDFVLDNHYGYLYKKGSSGHGLSPGEIEGPLPLNLSMEKGDKTLDEMKKSLKKGILITRFHYVNGFLNPHEALMTGLTRDGTFLIENGKIKKALKNLRFTQSILEAFSKVVSISKERKLVGDPAQNIGACLCPALLIKDFKFTGKTSNS